MSDFPPSDRGRHWGALERRGGGQAEGDRVHKNPLGQKQFRRQRLPPQVAEVSAYLLADLCGTTISKFSNNGETLKFITFVEMMV